MKFNKTKRKRIITSYQPTVFSVRAYDEYSQKNPVLTLNKAELDALNSSVI